MHVLGKNRTLQSLLLLSLILILVFSLFSSIAEAASEKCGLSKSLTPIQSVTAIINKVTWYVKKIDSVQSQKKISPSIENCVKKLDAYKRKMKTWLKGIDKNDKKVSQSIAKQTLEMVTSYNIMTKEMILVGKRVPNLKSKNKKSPSASKTTKQKKYTPSEIQIQAQQAAKKLEQVVSPFVLQPIKDYSDSAPIPTSLDFSPMSKNECRSSFSNSIWSLMVRPNRKTKAGTDKDEFLRYTKALTIWTGRNPRFYMIHLRNDGIFGLSWSTSYKILEKNGKSYFDAGTEKPRLYYDPANRWIHEEGRRVNLYWQNINQPYPLTSNTKAKYEISVSGIIESYARVFQITNFIPNAINRNSAEFKKLKDIAYSKEGTLKITKNSGNCSESQNNVASSLVSEKRDQIAKLSTVTETKVKTPKLMVTKKIATTTLMGCWNWANGGYIVIEQNGKARNGNVKANWKTVDAIKQRYKIIWPPIIDTLTLSANKSELSGSNSFGLPVSAKRKTTPKASNLMGRWLWNGGLLVDIYPDNTLSGGVFHGRVKKAGDSWIIEWPVDDEVSMSSDGNSLKLKNQFGALTATRDKSCNKR